MAQIYGLPTNFGDERVMPPVLRAFLESLTVGPDYESMPTGDAQDVWDWLDSNEDAVMEMITALVDSHPRLTEAAGEIDKLLGS